MLLNSLSFLEREILSAFHTLFSIPKTAPAFPILIPTSLRTSPSFLISHPKYVNLSACEALGIRSANSRNFRLSGVYFQAHLASLFNNKLRHSFIASMFFASRHRSSKQCKSLRRLLPAYSIQLSMYLGFDRAISSTTMKRMGDKESPCITPVSTLNCSVCSAPILNNIRKTYKFTLLKFVLKNIYYHFTKSYRRIFDF